jgi:hypothetical protein
VNYLASNKRAAFMQENCPDVYILPNRPSFSGAGGTDSIEYAWMVWRPMPGSGNRVGMLQVLDTTPKAERKL